MRGVRRRRLSRRTVLRGMGGTAVGLPLLDVMLDGHGEALAAGAPLPRRYLVAFAGMSLRSDLDSSPSTFTPSKTGPGYDLPPGLAPLDGFGSVRNQVSVVSGLSIPAANDSNSPAGGRNGDFHKFLNPLLAGERQRGDYLNPHDPEQGRVTGPTSDQAVADAIAAGTTFKSLQYRVQVAMYGTLDANQDKMSFRRDPQGGIIALPPNPSPHAAYGSLFTGFVPPDPGDATLRALELKKRRSVLDLVDRSVGGLLPTLGKVDQQRLQRHYDEIRAIEKVLDAIPPAQTGECRLLADPGSDPTVGGDNGESAAKSGNAYRTDAGYSDEEIRARAFCDLVHMAFTCDLTRVVSLMFTMWQSNMNTYPITGHTYALHNLSHQGGNQRLSAMVAWHAKHFGYLVAKLRDTREGAGSLLDNSALALLFEGGDGQGAVPNQPSHTSADMGCLLAGRAGGLRAGEHIRTGGRHPVQMLITLMNAVGAKATTLGEVSGTIPELLG